MDLIMKQTINNEQVLDTVYDLASACGMRIDQFLETLQETYGDPVFDTKDLPEDVIAELEQAKTLRKESRDAKKKEQESAKRKEEIAVFRKQFPEIKAEQIPDSVWKEVAGGMDLLHAYAYYLLTQNQDGGHAQAVNEGNSQRSAAATGDGSTEPSFTREEVEKMSRGDVKKNYRNILRSMSKWKF